MWEILIIGIGIQFIASLFIVAISVRWAEEFYIKMLAKEQKEKEEIISNIEDMLPMFTGTNKTFKPANNSVMRLRNRISDMYHENRVCENRLKETYREITDLRTQLYYSLHPMDHSRQEQSSAETLLRTEGS